MPCSNLEPTSPPTSRLTSILMRPGSGSASLQGYQVVMPRADCYRRPYAPYALPAEEVAELWDAFNREMNRLYALLSRGKEPDLGE